MYTTLKLLTEEEEWIDFHIDISTITAWYVPTDYDVEKPTINIFYGDWCSVYPDEKLKDYIYERMVK